MMIDFHAHIGRLVKSRSEFTDAACLVNRMDAWGIDMACVLPVSETPEPGILEADTEDVLAACSLYPSRLIPFCLIDPRFRGNDPKAEFGDLLTEYRARGCRGFGEVTAKMPADDPRMLNVFRQAGRAELPVLFHMRAGEQRYGLTDDPGLPRLERALQECPDTAFIGHAQTFWAEIAADVPEADRAGYPSGPIRAPGAVPRLMAQYENLWGDLCASGYLAIARDAAFGLEFLDQFQDKLLFGLDCCQRNMTVGQRPIVAFFRKLRDEALLPEAAWAKLAAGNACRLLGLSFDRLTTGQTKEGKTP